MHNLAIVAVGGAMLGAVAYTAIWMTSVAITKAINSAWERRDRRIVVAGQVMSPKTGS